MEMSKCHKQTSYKYLPGTDPNSVTKQPNHGKADTKKLYSISSYNEIYNTTWGATEDSYCNSKFVRHRVR